MTGKTKARAVQANEPIRLRKSPNFGITIALTALSVTAVVRQMRSFNNLNRL